LKNHIYISFCYEPEGCRSGRNDKKFLESQFVTSVFSSIDHIEARNGKDIGVGVSSKVGIMLPERHSLGSSSSLGSGKRDCR